MSSIYFDNAASTALCEAAAEQMNHISLAFYGNPSSVHDMGTAAATTIAYAAEAVADVLNVSNMDIIWTSGGTEANNLAILGSCKAAPKTHRKIITNLAEHPSVLEPFKHLAANGFEMVVVPLSQDGVIDARYLEDAVCDKTALVSMMHVNNVTGVMQNVALLGEIIKRKNPGTYFHVDGIQSFCKHAVNLKNIDLYSMSGHKIHGPKGVGALAVKKDLKLAPLFYGGGHQQGLRPGTENTAGIAGFAAAAENYRASMQANSAAVQNLKAAFLSGVAAIENTQVNGGAASPYIVNVSFLGVKSETLLNALQEQGIYISAGAACHGSKRSDHVLEQYGAAKDVAESSIRFSFSPENTTAEVSRCIEVLKESVAYLRKFKKI